METPNPPYDNQSDFLRLSRLLWALIDSRWCNSNFTRTRNVRWSKACFDQRTVKLNFSQCSLCFVYTKLREIKVTHVITHRVAHCTRYKNSIIRIQSYVQNTLFLVVVKFVNFCLGHEFCFIYKNTENIDMRVISSAHGDVLTCSIRYNSLFSRSL